MSIPDFILDKRIIDRNVAKGVLSPDDLTKALAKLPDMEENAEVCTPDGPKEEEESTDEAE